MQYIGFNLGANEYTIPILKVREIINMPAITRMPQSLPYIEGVTNIRGNIIPIVNLKKLVNLNNPPIPPLEKGGKGGFDCKVHHSEVWGLREKKYDWLLKNDIKTTRWKKIKPKSEFYLFIPRDEGLLKQYQSYPKTTDIFPVNSVGIVTSRDNFVLDFDRDVLRRRILQFRDRKLPDEIIQQTYNLKDKSNWKLKDARKNVMKDDNWEQAITKILYRPFDEQWIFFHDAVIEISRKEVMQHMIQDNLALLTHRREELDVPYTHVLVTNLISEHGCLSSKTTNYHFPLYLYIETNKPKKRKTFGSAFMLFEPGAPYTIKKTNISESIIQRLSSTYGKQPSPEDIFYYIYAVLYSNVYRTKYAEFLKIDFPRAPFTKDYSLFIEIGKHGKKVVDLHLLKANELNKPIAKFQGSGDNRTRKQKYDSETKRVHINDNQYFEGIEKDVREYQIGGYHVLDKWLKDRKDRVLSLDDIKHYCRIVTAIQKTIEIQKAIDDLYPEVEKETIELIIRENK